MIITRYCFGVKSQQPVIVGMWYSRVGLCKSTGLLSAHEFIVSTKQELYFLEANFVLNHILSPGFPVSHSRSVLVRPRTHTASLVGTSMPTESMAVIGQGSPAETNILIG